MSDKSPLLARTPWPNEAESFVGYVLRLSETNGYETPWHVMAVSGINRNQLSSAGLPVANIAAVTGVPPDLLARIAYFDPKGEVRTYKLLSQPMGKSLTNQPLRFTKPAFCPQCAAERGFIEAFWDLSAAVACPHHGRWAVSVCAACGASLSWLRPGLTICRCSADLREQLAGDAPSHVTDLMKHLHARLMGEPISSLPEGARFEEVFPEDVPFEIVLLAIERLGKFQRQAATGRLGVDAQSSAELASEALSNWPEGYHAMLDSLGKQFLAERPEALGFRNQFFPLFSAVYKGSRLGTHVKALKSELVAFGIKKWGRATVHKKLKAETEDAGTDRFISLTQYAELHKLWAPTRKRMIADGTIVITTIGIGKSKRYVVDLERTTPPVTGSTPVTAREAAARLGIPVSVLESLRETGIYAAKPRTGSTASWYMEDTDEALRTWLAPAPTLDTLPPGGVLVRDAMRLKFRDASLKAKIVERVLNGQIRILGRMRDSVGDLVIDDRELTSLIADLRLEASCDTYSYDDASKLTGIESMFLDCALSNGLLDRATVRGRRRIVAESVHRFNTEYTTLAKLAVEWGTSSRRLAGECGKANVETSELAASEGSRPPLLYVRRKSVHRLQEQFEVSQANKLKPPSPSPPELLKRYLDQLRSLGTRLPRRGGKPQLEKIARSCGFERSVFYNNELVSSMLSAFSEAEETVAPSLADKTGELRVRAYLDALRSTGESLPMWSGKPALVQIAKRADIDRTLFYKYPDTLALVHAFACSLVRIC